MDPNLIPGILLLTVAMALLCVLGFHFWFSRKAIPAGQVGLERRFISGAADSAEDSGASWTPSFDRAFRRLVVDTGLPLQPAAATVLLLGSGLCVAGAVYVAYENVLLAMVGWLFGMSVILVIGYQLRARRRSQVLAHLPGTVEMVARAVRAGESLEQALQSISKRIQGPLAVDLRHSSRQVELGVPVGTALYTVEERTPTLDIRMFVGALSLHRQTGGNLPTALERLALVTRERLAYRRELRSTTSAARFAALCVSAAAPILFVYYVFAERVTARMWNDASGRFFMLLAIGLEIVGIAWLWYLSRSQV